MESLWRGVVAARVMEEILYANRGRWPQSIWQLRRLSRRFGIRKWVFVSPTLIPEPHVRRNVLYLPRLRHDPARLGRFVIHEIVEQCLKWEGTEPCICPGVQRHEIASLVEAQGCGEGVEDAVYLPVIGDTLADRFPRARARRPDLHG